MQYIVRIASYDKTTHSRASVFNMPARDYPDAVAIKLQMEATESRQAVICIRLRTQAGPVLLNVDELQGFHDDLGDAISATKIDQRPKFKTA